MSIQLRGFYRAKPVVEPERLEGSEIFAALADQQRYLELRERDLTVQVGQHTYPLLRLRSARQLDYCGRKYLRLEFGRRGAPWLRPLTLCCWSEDGMEAGVGGHGVVETLIVGYPQFASEWVVEQRAC